ncbi:MAG TPA: DUF1572 family protein [Opitutus sp.]|nr:DUF1572 family protein [Opitutus sp.]
MSPESYLALAVREFRRLKKLSDDAMAQCPDDQFFAAPGPGDNSVAVLVKHMAGNLVSRFAHFLTSDGEKPDRDRDAEFEILPADTRASLTAAWERGWNLLFTELGALTDADLGRTVTIRGEPLTVLQALNRQLMHYAYHAGQVVYVAKHFRGGAWKTLSIPRGGSAAFNQSPATYLSNR